MQMTALAAVVRNAVARIELEAAGDMHGIGAMLENAIIN
jgi:hypothetical protein